MTTHYEEHNAADTTVGWVGPLTLIGEGQVPAGMYAVTLDSDESTLIIGTAEDIEALFEPLRRAVFAIREHAAQPLTTADYLYDGEVYLCPRCNGRFAIEDSDPLSKLIEMIERHIETHRPEHEVSA